MAEAKPLASLSAGLLARKGAARPAMRRQAALPGVATPFNGHDDLGWNDMGYDVDPHHAAPEAPRALGHGLSPMAQTAQDIQDAREESDAMDAFTAAVERAMVDPAPVGPATIAPMIADAPLPTPEEPPLVLRQRERMEAAVEDMRVPVALPVVVSPVARSRQPSARAQAGTRGSYAFTLRLDPDRHLRLRLASATSNRSSQQILIALVDEFLSTIPEIEAFAARLPASAAR